MKNREEKRKERMKKRKERKEIREKEESMAGGRRRPEVAGGRQSKPKEGVGDGASQDQKGNLELRK